MDIPIAGNKGKNGIFPEDVPCCRNVVLYSAAMRKTRFPETGFNVHTGEFF